MKRDLDLVRRMMGIFEEMPPGPFCRFNMEAGATPAEVYEHLSLMIDAGLIRGRVSPNREEPDRGGFLIEGITWAGHDFLDAARNDEIWAKTKKRLLAAGSWSFGLLLEVLKDEGKRRIGALLP